MTAVIDPLASVTGWSASGSGRSGIDPVIMTPNTYPQYCAGGQASSLLFQFNPSNPGAYVQKTISFSMSGYEEIVFSLYSVRQHAHGAPPDSSSGGFDQVSDFLYQVDFGDGRLYLVPTWGTFTHVTIPAQLFGTTALTRIRITYLGNNLDYLVVSWMVANFQDLPSDIMNGVALGLQAAFTSQFGMGLAIGTLTCAAGAASISLTGLYSFVNRYSVLYISDGASSETHQVLDTSGPSSTFNSTFDGSTTKYAHTGARVYVTVPIQIGKWEQDIPLPGVIIWSDEAEPVLLGSDYDQFVACWGTGGAVVGPALVQEGRTERWRMVIDCAAREGQPLAAAGTVARTWLAQHVVWVNGARLEFTWSERPTGIEPTDPVELIPKVSYTVEIELKEDVWVPIPTPPAVAGASGQVVNVQEALVLP